jgi:hypothetical protein
VVVQADRCIKLDPSYDMEKCSMAVVNPVTATCFMEIVQANRHAAGARQLPFISIILSSRLVSAAGKEKISP